MTQEECREVIRRTSIECFDRTLDLALLFCYTTVAIASNERSARGAWRAGRMADALLERYHAGTIRSWWSRLRAKGWIGRDLRVTAEGQRRLSGLLPRIRWGNAWDGHWYLVSFDIPERMASQRRHLRSVLHRLHFGKLHASLWIAPWDMLGDVQRAMGALCSDRHVIFGTAERVGTSEARQLANSVWPLQVLNDRYRSIVDGIRSSRAGSTITPCEYAGAFLAVLRDDPQLPRELLPRPWYGAAALRAVERRAGPLPLVR